MSCFRTSCPTVLGAPRFEQVRTFKQWLLPNFHKFVSRYAETMWYAGCYNKVDRSELSDEVSVLKTYSTAVEVLQYTNSYGSLLEVGALSHQLV